MEPNKDVVDSISQPGALAGWLIAAALGIQKAVAMFSSTRRDIAATGAETHVVELLRAEVQRLSEANEKLLKDVEQLHGQVMNLQTANTHLMTVVEQLRSQLQEPKA